MLVLSRHVDESIVLTLPDGREILILTAEIRGDKVRLGIEAPSDIAVHRFEVHQAIRAAGRSVFREAVQ